MIFVVLDLRQEAERLAETNRALKADNDFFKLLIKEEHLVNPTSKFTVHFECELPIFNNFERLSSFWLCLGRRFVF
jgi:hypothetical protein